MARCQCVPICLPCTYRQGLVLTEWLPARVSALRLIPPAATPQWIDVASGPCAPVGRRSAWMAQAASVSMLVGLGRLPLSGSRLPVAGPGRSSAVTVTVRVRLVAHCDQTVPPSRSRRLTLPLSCHATPTARPAPAGPGPLRLSELRSLAAPVHKTCQSHAAIGVTEPEGPARGRERQSLSTRRRV